MKRREFITIAGGAAAWPLAVLAQQKPTKPLIGFLNSASPISYAPMVATFQDGLNQMGFEGRDIAVEYHWAEGDYDLLPWFAAMLVNHKVAAIISGGGPAALAAKSATTSIPIIFSSRADPIQLGLITALKQPRHQYYGCGQHVGGVRRQTNQAHTRGRTKRHTDCGFGELQQSKQSPGNW